MLTGIPLPDFEFADDIVLEFGTVMPQSPSIGRSHVVEDTLRYFGFSIDNDDNPLKSTSNSIVYKGKSADECEYALKVCFNKQRIRSEFDKYFELIPESDFLVKTYDLFESDNLYIMQMELCQYGDIYTKKLSENEIWQVANNIGQALHDLHMHNVIHLDVSPSNILRNDKFFKLSDFGTICEIGKFHEGMEGAGPYVSPEILEYPRRKVTGKTDIFSLGLVLLECATGYFVPRGGDDNYSKIRRGEIKLGDHYYSASGLSDELVNLINAMIEPDQDKRPSAYQVVLETCRVARERNWI